MGVAAFVLREYTEASSYFLESASQFESLGGNLGACEAQVDLGCRFATRASSLLR